MYTNTIILRHGRSEITNKGESIFGVDSDAQEVKRWPIEQKADALAELAEHRCTYRELTTFIGSTVLQADEWALEFCACDEDGDYVGGSDYELAAEG